MDADDLQLLRAQRALRSCVLQRVAHLRRCASDSGASALERSRARVLLSELPSYQDGASPPSSSEQTMTLDEACRVLVGFSRLL
jgi:hypothetical protein